MKRTVTTIYPDVPTAAAAVRDLFEADFEAEQVSLLMDRATREAEFPGEEHPVEAGTGWGATVGALASGAAMLGFLTVGGLAVAGPLGAVLTATSTGAVGGGLVGALASLGFTSKEAEAFEAALRAGGVAVAVETETQDRATDAMAILERRGGPLGREHLTVTKPQP